MTEFEFDEVINYAILTYAIIYGKDDEDIDNNFFCCPNCEEPIYRCDYPKIKFKEEAEGTGTGSYICPVCEEEF